MHGGPERGVPPGDPHHDLGADLHLAGGVVASMQPDDVEPGVLPALQQVVADLQRRAVPIVVPHRARLGVGVERPQHGRRRAVQRDHPEVVVPRAAVVERVPVGVAGGRTLRQVPRHQVGTHRFARPAVQEVVVGIVGALADLDRAAGMLDHVRLAGPAGPAPRPGAEDVPGGRTQPARGRVPPPDHRVSGDRPLAVVVPGGVAPERGQARVLRVDRPRRRPGRGRRTGNALRWRRGGTIRTPCGRARPRSP